MVSLYRSTRLLVELLPKDHFRVFDLVLANLIRHDCNQLISPESASLQLDFARLTLSKLVRHRIAVPTLENYPDRAEQARVVIRDDPMLHYPCSAGEVNGGLFACRSDRCRGRRGRGRCTGQSIQVRSWRPRDRGFRWLSSSLEYRFGILWRRIIHSPRC